MSTQWYIKCHEFFSSLNFPIDIFRIKSYIYKWSVKMKRKRELEMPLETITGFCKRWKIKEFSIFGSILREDFSPQSDIDVLLSFWEGAPWGLFEFVEMRDELKTIFGRDVDIVEKEGLKNPFRRREILRTRKVIYAART